MDLPVRRLRRSLGLSRRQFGERAGIHPVYLAQLEAGQYGMGRTAALRIVDAFRREMFDLGISLEELLRGADARRRRRGGERRGEA